jgi:four helix bundle protein
VDSGQCPKEQNIIRKGNTMPIRNFQDLIVWQKAMDYTVEIYKATACFPKEEIYGLRAQVRNSSSSIPVNIAEGQGRKTTRDFLHFLSIAHGSLCESQTHLLLAERLKYLTQEATHRLMERAEEIARLLNALKDSLKRKSNPKK